MENICVIIPAYQEEPAVLRTTIEALYATHPGYTIVLVDDGSKPSMEDAVHGLQVHYLRHAMNLGQGASLETGMGYARKLGANYVIHFDADGQHDPADLPTLLAPLRADEADIVLGSRFLKAEHEEAIPPRRRRLLKLARSVERRITGLDLSDAHCGLRALGPKAIEKIRLKEARMAHATELIKLIKHHKLRYMEAPVHVRYSAYTQEKGQGPLGSIKILWDLLVRSWL